MSRTEETGLAVTGLASEHLYGLSVMTDDRKTLDLEKVIARRKFQKTENLPCD